MLKLQRYQFSVRHAYTIARKERNFALLTLLSRARFADHPSASDAKQEYEVFRLKIAEMDIQPSRLTPQTMQRINQETAKDSVLASVCDVVASGCPAERKETPGASKTILEFQRRDFRLRWRGLSLSSSYCPFLVVKRDDEEKT